MTIFLYRDGLVRLASEKYTKNDDEENKFIHLTNYSLNKKSENYDGDEHKLQLSDVLWGSLYQEQTKVRRESEDIWKEIEDIVIKTMLSIQPQLQHLYKSSQAKEPDCVYDLLGFDIMLDSKLRPWLLEVNHLPSFNADTEVDKDVKSELVQNTLTIM